MAMTPMINLRPWAILPGQTTSQPLEPLGEITIEKSYFEKMFVFSDIDYDQIRTFRIDSEIYDMIYKNYKYVDYDDISTSSGPKSYDIKLQNELAVPTFLGKIFDVYKIKEFDGDVSMLTQTNCINGRDKYSNKNSPDEPYILKVIRSTNCSISNGNLKINESDKILYYNCIYSGELANSIAEFIKSIKNSYYKDEITNAYIPKNRYISIDQFLNHFTIPTYINDEDIIDRKNYSNSFTNVHLGVISVSDIGPKFYKNEIIRKFMKCSLETISYPYKSNYYGTLELKYDLDSNKTKQYYHTYVPENNFIVFSRTIEVPKGVKTGLYNIVSNLEYTTNADMKFSLKNIAYLNTNSNDSFKIEDISDNIYLIYEEENSAAYAIRLIVYVNMKNKKIANINLSTGYSGHLKDSLFGDTNYAGSIDDKPTNLNKLNYNRYFFLLKAKTHTVYFPENTSYSRKYAVSVSGLEEHDDVTNEVVFTPLDDNLTKDEIKDIVDDVKKAEDYYPNKWENDDYSKIMYEPNEVKNIFNFDDISEDLSDYHIHSLKSIIGLPAKFLPHVDMHLTSGESGKFNGFGRLYMKQIVYDMPIAIFKPGVPKPAQQSVLDKLSDYGLIGSVEILAKNIKELIEDPKQTLESWFVNIFTDKYQRLYKFKSDIDHYIQYVNTLCHMFAIFLGIGDKKYYYEATKESIAYKQFNELYELGVYSDMANSDNDEYILQGDEYTSLKTLFGGDPAVYIYFSPDSVPRDVFTTTPEDSVLNGTVNGLSQQSKQIHFIAGAALGGAVNDFVSGIGNAINSVFDALGGERGILSGLFGGLGEGVGVIVGGHNYDTPKMWEDTKRQTGADLNIKLISPYGDPESIFLYVMRPLAKLLALAVPKQYGANSYTSPFIIQAFSKGIFNINFGLIESLSISRGGSGGSQHTNCFIPSELDINISLMDAYPQFALSNEYAGIGQNILSSILSTLNISKTMKAIGLLFNNIGLMQFVASYTGFNMNAPASTLEYTFFWQIFQNRIDGSISISDEDVKFLGFIPAKKIYFPRLSRVAMDAYNDSVHAMSTFGR